MFTIPSICQHLSTIFAPVYIAVGLLFVMLLLAVVYEIPEFNLGLHLSMRSDEFEEKGENVRLTNVGVNLPPRYMTQVSSNVNPCHAIKFHAMSRPAMR